ncbi:MAG TPA: phasin family protein [Alphaproteobacteria bacterium]|nr:phasin family protein [Alphaproteobacteria bacterium]
MAQKDATETPRRGADAGQNHAQEGNDAARHVANAAIDASLRAGDAGADTARQTASAAGTVTAGAVRAGADQAARTVDTARDMANTTLNGANDMVRQATDQMGRIFGMGAEGAQEASQKAQDNIKAVVEGSNIVLDGYRTLWREWAGRLQERMQRNVEGMNQLARCRSLQDVAATQSTLLRETVTGMLDDAVKLAELSADIAGRAVNRMHDGTEGAALQAAQGVDRAAGAARDQGTARDQGAQARG